MAQVLIVEDNHDSARAMALALEGMGHAVAVVNDPRDAVQVALEVQPEVALVDIGMPHINGWKLARSLRAERALAGLRIYALTAYGGALNYQQSADAGFDLHLMKPFDPVEMDRLLAGH